MAETNHKTRVQETPNTPARRLNNAWIISLGDRARLEGLSVTIDLGPTSLMGIQEKDAVLMVEESDGSSNAIAIGRIFRKRSTMEAATFYFDGLVRVEPNLSLDDLGIPSLTTDTAVIRLEWALFETALKTGCNLDWSLFPVLSDGTPREQAYISKELGPLTCDTCCTYWTD